MARTNNKKPGRKQFNGKAIQLKSARKRPLRDFTEEALQRYFKDLDGHRPGELYGLVLGEIEPPLFSAVMDYTQGNQTLAAEILGMNRATLRKKLKQYQLLA